MSGQLRGMAADLLQFRQRAHGYRIPGLAGWSRSAIRGWVTSVDAVLLVGRPRQFGFRRHLDALTWVSPGQELTSTAFRRAAGSWTCRTGNPEPGGKFYPASYIGLLELVN